MTKTTGNFTDFLDFTRNSGGTSLRRIAYGSELVTNGTFDTDTTGWTDGSTSPSTFTASSGVGVLTVSSSQRARARQTITGLTVGRVYQLQFDSIDSIEVNVGYTVMASTEYMGGTQPTGLNTLNFVALDTTLYLQFHRAVDGTYSFDNVSVKEVTLDAPYGDLVLFNHPDDIPRVEYDANGNVKGLLIEEGRTNVVGYSEDTSQWSEDGTATITNSTQIAPDGTASATLVDIGSTGSSLGPNRISRFSSGLSASTKATVSVFLKKPDTDAASHVNVRLFCAGTTATDMYVDYDTSDFTSVNSSGVVDTIHASEDYGNGWFRISFTGTLNASATGANNFRLGGVVSGSHPSTGTDFIMWGAQVETGGFATSYIPTSGATATRNADICSIDVDSFGWHGGEAGSGTVVVDVQSNNWQFEENNQYLRVFEFNGHGNNGLYRAAADGDGDQFRYRLSDSSDGAAFGPANIGAATASITDGAKVALAYAPDDFAIAANGASPTTDTSGTFDTLAVTTISIGKSTGSSNFLNGYLKSFQYYPRRLTNAQLQELTS